MISSTLVFAAALAVLPSDRMSMADRLFDRGQYADAKAEYVAVKGAEGIAADELLYRLAECERALGDKAAARKLYGELLEKHPLSRHASRARLMRALAGSEADQKAELKVLDSDKVPADIRAAALYHYGVLAADADALARCVKLAPKGHYAAYAKFRHASMTVDNADASVRRMAIGELMDLHYGPDKEMGREALYLAASKSYASKRYGEASSLFRRYLKVYPTDTRATDARTMAAWSDYLTGKFADAAALCGEGKTDDAAYLLAACAYSSGDSVRAKTLMKGYLDRFPQGRYREAVELPLARMAFESAEKSSDTIGVIEAARRSAALSKSSSDRLRLAWAYEKGERTAEAIAEYEGVAKDFPGTDDAAEALFRKAMIDLRAQKWSAADLALAEAQASGKNAKRKAETLYWRGIAANRLGHEAEGCQLLTEAPKLALSLDQTREARLLLADADFKAGRQLEAKTAYAKLVREGACERMSAAKLNGVGRFLLACKLGDDAQEEAKMCARALVANGQTPAWRQTGYILQAQAEEAAGEFSSAIETYALAFAEKVRTESAPEAALSYGILLSKADRHVEADKILKEAVSLNAKDAARRARAYLWLAKNSEAMTDYHGACAYATVVVTLFDNPEITAEAKKILEEHAEEAK